MTIIRATEETEVRAGHWVHGPSSLQYGQHSEPRKVTRIAGKRVHYKRLDGTESFMLRANVLMVCDTEAEAIQVHFLSTARDRHIGDAVRNVLSEKAALYEDFLSNLVRGEHP
jgi:hypothetical protein